MIMRKPMVVVAAVVCALALVLPGCRSSGAVGTTASAGTAGTTESAGTAVAADLYPVAVGGKWGYIGKTGAIKIQPQFDRALDFSDGLALVLMEEGDVQKWGYVDTSGAVVIQPQFDTAWPFSERLAAVGKGSADDALYGFIDKTGKVVIALPQNQQPIGSFSGGVVGVRDSTTNDFAPAAYIDVTGKVVWQAE
jgi:hypothetical protein